jgi:hypothetical protein
MRLPRNGASRAPREAARYGSAVELMVLKAMNVVEEAPVGVGPYALARAIAGTRGGRSPPRRSDPRGAPSHRRCRPGLPTRGSARDPLNTINPSGLCSLGPIRIGFLSNDDDSCRGAGLVSNPVAQTIFVPGACTCTAGTGCFLANGIVVGINAINRYDACEVFSTDSLMHTGIDIAAAAVNLRSLRNISGTLSMEDHLGNAVLRTTVTGGAGLPPRIVVDEVLVPNLMRATAATVVSSGAHWLSDRQQG